MLTILLIVVSTFGLFISKYLKLGPCNPFTLFFGVWSAIFILYSIFKDLYINLSQEYLFIHLCIQIIAFFFMMCVRPDRSVATIKESPYKLNQVTMLTAQIFLLLVLPIIYQKSVEFAGANIFTSHGYTRLRYAYNEAGQDIGALRYVYFFSFLVSAIAVYFASINQLSKWRAVIAIITALCYAYLATGRTFFLMVFAFTVTPLIITKKINLSGLVLLASILVGSFFLLALLTSKGASTDASFSDNITGFIDSIQSYVIAPFVALSMLYEESLVMSMGDHSLRFILSLLSALGFTDPPGPIVKGYKYTPITTNLYTVYEVYFRDFNAIGFFIPLIFLPIHWFLYKMAQKKNDFFIIIYAISTYPLLTQILQDQYMTLISSWIQVFIGCIILIGKSSKKTLDFHKFN